MQMPLQTHFSLIRTQLPLRLDRHFTQGGRPPGIVRALGLWLCRLAAVVGALSVGGGIRAHAAAVRPNILIIFDTSGSMLQGDGADGTLVCDGRGSDNRLASLKAAVRESVALVGGDEANFGLMRFAVTPNQTRINNNATDCTDGFYDATFSPEPSLNAQEKGVCRPAEARRGVCWRSLRSA